MGTPAAPAGHPHVRSLLSSPGGWTCVEAWEAQVGLWLVLVVSAASLGLLCIPSVDLGVEA